MMNILAMLVSLAMMLTGGAGQEGMQTRTLLIRNVTLTVNGERTALEPVVRLGASTDGETALIDFGVDSEGAALLPVQVRGDADGLAVLFEKSDVLARVSQAALEGAAALAVPDAAAMETAGLNPELLGFLTGEFKDAYMGLFEAIQAPDFAASLQEKADALLAQTVDRGVGKTVTEEVNGVSRVLTEYVYTMDATQLAKLCDELFKLDDALSSYYDAYFKLFSMLPEESGLTGVKSYADLFDKTGIKVDMLMDERRSEDNAVNLTDAVITMDMSAMMAGMAGDATQSVKLDPVVMNVRSVKVDQSARADMDMSFAFNGSEMDMSMRVVQDYGAVLADVAMYLYTDGESVGSMHMNLGQGAAGEGGAVHSHAEIDLDVGGKGSFEMSFIGRTLPDNLGEANVTVGGEVNGNSFELSFDAELTAATFEDRIVGREADIAVDDLSQEALSALMSDQSVMGKVMQIAGSMSADAQKLTGDESVKAFTALLAGIGQNAQDKVKVEIEEVDGPEDGAALYDAETLDGLGEDDYVIDIQDLEGLEDGDLEFAMGDFDDGDYEEIEDDGVLGFNVPELTWLPEGWKVYDQSQDTAYDWADMSIRNAKGDDVLYVVFFVDDVTPQTNYIVADDGAITPVEGREINVADYGEGSMSVTVHDKGLYANLIFSDDTVDVNAIGKIVAGIKY